MFVLVASSWLRCGTGVRFSELCIAAPPFKSKGLCVLSCLDSFRCRFSEVQCSAGNGGAISNTERAKAKVVTYGIVYGSGPAGEPTAEMLPPARSSWWHLAGCSDAVAEIHSPQCSTAWQCCGRFWHRCTRHVQMFLQANVLHGNMIQSVDENVNLRGLRWHLQGWRRVSKSRSVRRRAFSPAF